MTLVDHSPLAPSAPPAVGSVPAQRRSDRPVGRTTGRSRDRYIDCLRAAALVRVVIYHIFGWVWLPVLFPSMAIMFALAGSLVAASLDRSPGRPWPVLAKRTRRLLPPLWLMGLILVPIMIWHGWTYNAVTGSPLQWRTLLLWIVPISDPPGSSWGDDFVVPLWYIRAYLWFLLLSPAFLWMFRHWPKRVLAVPLVSLALGALGVVTFSGRSGDVILSMSIFGACWILGFAHHDNTLRSIPLRKIVPVGVGLLVAGLAWALTHQDPQTHWDIDNIPVADALYGLGAVLLLLRFYPDFSWVSRRRMLDKLVTVVNSRAMTIYLWNNVAIFCTTAVAGAWSVTAALDNGGVTGRVQQLALTWILIAVTIVVFGWVEDVAAARPIRINPWPGTRQPVTRTARTRQPVTGTARTRPVRTRPARAARPAPLLIGTAALVGTAVGISVVTLQGTDTPGRTAITDAVPNTPAHPQALQPRPANLAQPNLRPPVRSPHQQPTGGTGPTPAPTPTTGTPPPRRPQAAPSPTSAPGQASRASVGPVNEASPRPAGSAAPDAGASPAPPTAPVSPGRPETVPASPAPPPPSARSTAPTPAISAAPPKPAVPVSPSSVGTSTAGPGQAPASSPAAPASPSTVGPATSAPGQGSPVNTAPPDPAATGHAA